MKYKQAKKLQRDRSVYFNMIEWLKNEATSDDGMTRYEKLRFHNYNKHGVVNQFPVSKDFSFGEDSFAIGLWTLYSKYENYHAKKLRNYCGNKTLPSTWDVNHHIEEAEKDVREAWIDIRDSEFNLHGKKKARKICAIFAHLDATNE
tara:strand:+ start:64 stop:504 length:441 start_codon:yes stop_codon:yes gene_type:complete